MREHAVGAVELDGIQLNVDVWQEHLVVTGAEVVGAYTAGPGRGLAAVTRNAHGSGTGWYVSTRPDAEGLRAVMQRVYADAGIVPLDLPRGVEAVTRRGESADYLVAINHSETTVEIPAEGTDLLTGDAVAGRLTLQGGGVAVVRA